MNETFHLSGKINQIIAELGENAPFDTNASAIATQVQRENQDHPDMVPDSSLSSPWELLTTTRNKHLITEIEQQKLIQITVGFFGLSVGSHAVIAWELLSRARNIKIIDPDTIDVTNLNRLRTSFQNIGRKKIDVMMDELRGINPLAHVYTYGEHMPLPYEEIFTDVPPIDCVVDEIDDMEGKIRLRQLARERKLPLLSATDVGDTVLLDIERYDTDPSTQPFLGRIQGVDSLDALHLSPQEKIQLVLTVVGLENCSIRMLDSLLAIGRDLKTWPQLGSTATMAGGMIANVLKNLFIGVPIPTGRYRISLEEVFGIDVSGNQAEKKQKVEELKKRFGL